MRPIRAILTTALLVMATACTAAPAVNTDGASQAAVPTDEGSEPASEPSIATPSEAPPASEEEPSAPPDDGGEPDEAAARANAERALTLLTPPSSVQEWREEGPFELAVSFDSSATFDSLVAFYLEAIPASGLQVVEDNNDFPGTREWVFGTDVYSGAISLSPSEAGYRVTFFVLGEPPAG